MSQVASDKPQTSAAFTTVMSRAAWAEAAIYPPYELHPENMTQAKCSFRSYYLQTCNHLFDVDQHMDIGREQSCGLLRPNTWWSVARGQSQRAGAHLSSGKLKLASRASEVSMRPLCDVSTFELFHKSTLCQLHSTLPSATRTTSFSLFQCDEGALSHTSSAQQQFNSVVEIPWKTNRNINSLEKWNSKL